MQILLHWLKSTRSIVTTLFAIGLVAGLFVKVISGEQFMQAVMLVLGAYFAKRDTPQDRR